MNHDIESIETSDSEPLDFSAVQALLESAQPDDCRTCSGYGIVGRPPDDYFSCPACTPQQAEAPKAGAVPDGWKLVPVQPTTEMITAGSAHTDMGLDDDELEQQDLGAFYRARGRAICAYSDMLATAPQPQPAAPVPASAPVDERRVEEPRRSIIIGQAVVYFNCKWPAEASNGVMVFNGERMTKAEFEARAALAAKGGA